MVKTSFIVTFIGLLFTGIGFAQQITVNNSVSVQSLVENTLIQGCVEVTNVTSANNGSGDGIGSFGYFERGSSNFPFENGIVLTTGNANSSGNTQINTPLHDGTSSWNGDTDLENTLGITNTKNATVIEFDFKSSSSQMQFNYIFASEEYTQNFPCNYSDSFAFLIKQAGTNNPYQNIAVIPGTSTPVNTNTIHQEIEGHCSAENENYFAGYTVGDTNYNGRTVILSATTTIIPETQYHIKLVIADQDDQNYDSAVFIEGKSLNDSVDLGDDFTMCAAYTTLDTNINNSNANFTWYLNNVMVAGANQSTLQITESGTYKVEVSLPFLGSACTSEDEINATLNPAQASSEITDFILCDDISNDDVAIFDLTSKNDEILNSVAAGNYTISYHLTTEDMINDANAQSTSFQNTTNPQTIYVRIEDNDNGCLAFNSFDLIVNEAPSIVTPTPFNICENTETTSLTPIDFTLKDDEITNGNTSYIVTYHLTEAAAIANTNIIPIPYYMVALSKPIFARVTNPDNGCFLVTTFDVNIIPKPEINTGDHYIDGCDQDHDGFTTFDLTSIIPDVLDGVTNVTSTFHLTEDDAKDGINAINDDTNFTNTIANVQVVYIRVEDNTIGCASVTPIELHTNLLLTKTNINDVSICDIGNDGSEDISFDDIESVIVNQLQGVTVAFYETENDRDNQTNQINHNVPYPIQVANQIFFITITSTTCQEFAEIEVTLEDIVFFDAITNQTVCDDETNDGFTTINLAQTFNSHVVNGHSGYTITYFLSQADAENNINALPNVYTNTTNPFTLYPRITENSNGCASTNSGFQVEIIDTPETNTPNPIVICDDDTDGFYTINLETVIPEVVTTPENYNISFHPSPNAAENNGSVITNTNAYNTDTVTLYIRVESGVNGCAAIRPVSITIYPLIEIPEISEEIECEPNTDNIASFIFENKDDEILNDDLGMTVSYYASQEDANNRTNTIDKTVAYQNTSNPQTIYVRKEYAVNTDCFSTSNFEIRVSGNPIIPELSSFGLCDDLSNDGVELFDLQTKIEEITQGNNNLSVTFHTTLNQAESGENPLPLQYENTTNPQELYVRVRNNYNCYSTASFTLNVTPYPMLSEVPPFMVCDIDSDGFYTFDLTSSQNYILDVRQDNLDIAYYPSEADMIANTNEISNPEAYTNISNPQTAYLRVVNNLSSCVAEMPLYLHVNPLPTINEFERYQQCDNDTNTVDLSIINDIIVDTNFNIEISYYNNEANALIGENSIGNIYNYTNFNSTLCARVEYTTTRCYVVYPFEVQINPNPIANQPEDLTLCDDDFDGTQGFNLMQQNAIILGSQNPNEYSLSYHTTLDDANSSSNPIQTQLTNYQAANNTTIYARVENNNSGCYDVAQFNLFVNRKPFVDIPTQTLCLDDLPLTVNADTGYATDSYLWSTGENTTSIEITEVGDYSVLITSANNCQTTASFAVIASETATIESVEITDFTDPNSIMISVTGAGNYLYQLDNGLQQSSNIFNNVNLGPHTVTVYDANGCASVSRDVMVIDYPKHLTPNNDNAFDTWHIVGVETLPGTIVYIYDRHGKLLKTLTYDSKGWDGTYRGHKMPANDYWFLAKVKRNNIRFDVRGHFSLRR